MVSAMYSAEVLSQLRSLNWLTREIHRVPPACSEAALLQIQIESVRTRLPDAILEHHDRLARLGKSSAMEVISGTCGECHAPLPIRLLDELSTAGHFGVCPSCGVFLWSRESVASAKMDESNAANELT